MNTIEIINNDTCYGCGACSSACPQKCISMSYDSEGFLQPHISSAQCINCGKCLSSCPVKIKPPLNNGLRSFVAFNKEKETEKKSSSGGIFPLLASQVIKTGGYVCAAIMDHDLSVKHIIAHCMEDIESMQGSKYVQSSCFQCYEKIKGLLEAKKNVLFIGTPCQIAGLKSILRTDYANLLCVDLICHGVPSPLYFKQYIHKKYSKQITNVCFREKTDFEPDTYRFVLKNRNSKTQRVYGSDDVFYSAFLEGISFRECCYVCPFATPKRIGDITLGDCASFLKYDFPYGQICSTVLINTKKGLKWWEICSAQMQYKSEDLNTEIKMNKQLSNPVKRPQKRDDFYKDFIALPFSTFLKKYKKEISYISKLKRYIKRQIPIKIKGKIKRIINEHKINRQNFV